MMQQHEPLIKHISISFWSFLTVQKANLIYAIQRTRSTRENEEKVMSCMTFKKISFQKITKSPSYSQISHTRVPKTNSEGPKTYIQIPNGISTSLFLFFHSQTAYVLSAGFKGQDPLGVGGATSRCVLAVSTANLPLIKSKFSQKFQLQFISASVHFNFIPVSVSFHFI